MLGKDVKISLVLVGGGGEAHRGFRLVDRWSFSGNLVRQNVTVIDSQWKENDCVNAREP